MAEILTDNWQLYFPIQTLSMVFLWKCNGISLTVLLCIKGTVWYLLKFPFWKLQAYKPEVLLLAFLIRLLLAVSRSPAISYIGLELFGVTIDKDLTFKQHVSSICKKLKNQLSVMTRFGKLMSTETMLRLDKAFIHRHFHSCSMVWHFSSKQDSDNWTF